jgi:hypothetical protein
VRAAARIGLAPYLAGLAFAAIRARPQAEQPGDAALVPVVLAIMHFAHGVGMLAGAAQYGPPLSALAASVGLNGLSASLAPAPEPVFAPSLGPAET